MGTPPVGDVMFHDDPSVNRLQDRIADLLGKEAALFVPSGTMANQIALRVLTRPGDDVVVGAETHVAWHELGAAAVNSGVQFTVAGRGGIFTAAEFLATYKAPGHVVIPSTALVVIENTHNRGGGIVFPHKDSIAICEAARQLGVYSYLDGARLFNAAVATALTLRELAEPIDMASVALSKGLGCPAGSVLAGCALHMPRGVRARGMFGGAMRQVGILAAAGLYALDHNVARLSEDHSNARLMAERLAGVRGVKIDLSTAQTNIVVMRLEEGAPDAATVVARAKERGVWVAALAPRAIRAVTHLNVTREQCRQAADLLAGAIERS